MRLIAALTEGSGSNNEDGCGFLEVDGEIIAAWIFDGVTGINEKTFMPSASDATWIVERANHYLKILAGNDKPLPDILAALAKALEEDWWRASVNLSLPENYDPPGACLLLAKKYADGWKVLRLGDSQVIIERHGIEVFPVPRTTLNDEEDMLKREARKRRDAGVLDMRQLLKEFHAPILASRRLRNTEVGIGILVAGPESIKKPEYLNVGWATSILLCTDGYYRAVDCYGLHSDESLLRMCLKKSGATAVLNAIRKVEAADPDCQTYLRFKPADDATVVVLSD